jgi:hypothetical protein
MFVIQCDVLIYVHIEKWLSIKLANLSITSDNFFHVVRTLDISSLSKFQIHNTSLVNMVTFCTIDLLNLLITGSLCPLSQISSCLPSALVNPHSLWFSLIAHVTGWGVPMGGQACTMPGFQPEHGKKSTFHVEGRRLRICLVALNLFTVTVVCLEFALWDCLK